VLDRKVEALDLGKRVEHLGGVDWYDAGKEFRALPWWRRLFHTHKAQTRAWYDYEHAYLERCICGAYGFGRGYWTKRL
jgi:hypothetical protein